MLWRAAHGEQLRQGADHVFARDVAGNAQRQTLARELVDEPYEGPGARRAVEHESRRSDAILAFQVELKPKQILTVRVLPKLRSN